MNVLLRTQRIFFAISMYSCIFVSNLHYSDIPGVIGSEVPPIINNNNVSFIQSDEIQENITNFEISKPLPFVIPSYASGILLTPSQFLLPPVMINSFETTTKFVSTLNSNEHEKTTVLPITQRLNVDKSVDTIQFVSTQNPSSFTPSIPKGSFEFSSKSTIPPSSKIISTTTMTTTSDVTTASPLFPNQFVNTTEKITLTPTYNDSDHRESRRDDYILDDILGSQKPGYAVRPDGTIDSEALPPESIQYAPTNNSRRATTEVPTTTIIFPISHTASPTTTTTTTTTKTTTTTAAAEVKFTATSNVSKNITHNNWLQEATPFQQITSFFKQNMKSFIPSTTSHQFPTTTDSLPETTAQSSFEKLAQYLNGSSFNIGAQRVFQTTNGPPKQNNGQIINGISPKPFNIMKTTPNAVISHNNNNEITVNKILIPNSNLLPPQEENLQLSEIFRTTKTITLLPEEISTKLATFSSTVPTVPINSQDQTTTSIQHEHKTSAIIVPSIDLLPPTTINLRVDDITNESKPHDFLPHLDLNPFLAPFLGSVQNPNDTQTTQGTTLPPFETTTLSNSKVLLLDSSPFTYKKPAEPFIIHAYANKTAQQQQPFQPNKKYIDSFGAPPGILTPYDNLG